MNAIKKILLLVTQLAAGWAQLAGQDIASLQDNLAAGNSFDFPEIISKAKKNLPSASLSALEQKLKGAEQKNDSRDAASAASNLGLFFLAEKNYEKANQNFQTSLRHREKLMDKKNSAMIYGLMGYSDFQSGNLAGADENFNKGLTLFRDSRISKGTAMMNVYLGHVHDAQSSWDKAHQFYLAAAREYVSMGEKKPEAFCENKAGEMLLKSSDDKNALDHFQNARMIYESVKDPEGRAVTLRNIGIIYFRKGEFEGALDYFESSLASNYQLNTLRFVRDCYLKLQDVYGRKKNIEKATEYNELYNLLRDSVSRQENARALKRDEIKIQNIDRSNIIQMLNATTRQQYEKLSQQEIEMKRLSTETEIERLQKEKAVEALAQEKILSEESQRARDVEIERLQKEKAFQDLALSKKELELNRKENQRNILIGAGLIVLVLALFFYSRYHLKKRSHDALDKAYLELKQTHKKLQTAQQQLVQQEKLASLGQLTAGIAHEIQNPLNFVNNFSELSVEMVNEIAFAKTDEERAQFFEELKVNLQKIRYHSKRADSIVKSMLEHSRTGKGELQPSDFNKLCDEYLNLAFHGVRAINPEFNCELRREFSPEMPSVNMIQQDFARMLLNIFSNAFYAVNERSRQESSRESNWSPLVSVSTVHTPHENILVIRDNGTGIRNDIKQKIFEPFFTTKPSGQGTGLGLSIASDIIKAHAGKIKVTDNEEGGSTFTIMLPA